MDKYTNDHKPGDTEITLTRTTGGNHDQAFALRISDHVSGAEVLEIRLTGAQVADLVTGRTTDVEGATWRGVENIGKRKHVVSERFAEGEHEQALALSAEWEAQGWTVSTRKGRFGWLVTGRRWSAA